jgi:hypothetical protein
MVHTCTGESNAQVRRVVREPFLAYMQTIQSLWKDTVDALRTETAVAQGRLLDMVFERYFQKSTLFGSLETCLARAHDFELAGATELACMIDFGLSDDDGMASLGWLARLREAFATRRSPAAAHHRRVARGRDRRVARQCRPLALALAASNTSCPSARAGTTGATPGEFGGRFAPARQATATACVRSSPGAPCAHWSGT